MRRLRIEARRSSHPPSKRLFSSLDRNHLLEVTILSQALAVVDATHRLRLPIVNSPYVRSPRCSSHLGQIRHPSSVGSPNQTDGRLRQNLTGSWGCPTGDLQQGDAQFSASVSVVEDYTSSGSNPTVRLPAPDETERFERQRPTGPTLIYWLLREICRVPRLALQGCVERDRRPGQRL